MKKHFKLLTVLLSVILCFSLFTLCVWAIDADGDGYDDETGEYIGGGEVVEPEPVYTEPEPIYTEPEYTVPEYTNPINSESSDSGYDYSAPSYEESSNYSSSYNDNYYYEQPSYLGGGQSYIAPESTAPSVPLINSDDNIDVKELSSKDWKDIADRLKNTSASGSDGDDFGFIQNNNSASDNGEWMLVLGIVLIVLSVAGIIYFIASGVMLRKKLAFAGAPQSSSNTKHRYRSNDDYDDGFRTSARDEKQKSKKRRYDTADVKLPKNSGGRRYK